MKCFKCKGDGRQNNGGSWGLCEKCNGTGTVEGKDSKLIQAIMGAGYSHEEAVEIAERGTSTPEPTQAAEPPAAFPSKPGTTALTVGSKVRGKSNGKEMTVTGDLGGGEFACEWPITKDVKGKQVEGKDSGIFNDSSLELVSDGV